MDYFEQIVVRLMEARGYWARRSVFVELTREDKRSLGKPSMPRPEIDVVAYKPGNNELVLLEVKSWLDSVGVAYAALSPTEPSEGRLKILTNQTYKKLVQKRLVEQFQRAGLLTGKPTVRFGLAAGRIKPGDQAEVQLHADREGWLYLSPHDISDWVKSLADKSYENDPVTLAAKLILRDHGSL